MSFALLPSSSVQFLLPVGSSVAVMTDGIVSIDASNIDIRFAPAFKNVIVVEDSYYVYKNTSSFLQTVVLSCETVGARYAIGVDVVLPCAVQTGIFQPVPTSLSSVGGTLDFPAGLFVSGMLISTITNSVNLSYRLPSSAYLNATGYFYDAGVSRDIIINNSSLTNNTVSLVNSADGTNTISGTTTVAQNAVRRFRITRLSSGAYQTYQLS